MAIQRINLGTAPSGTGGDTNRSAFTKIDGNFADNTNAASRQVGTAAGNVMEVGAFGVGTGERQGYSEISVMPTDDDAVSTSNTVSNAKTGFFKTKTDGEGFSISSPITGDQGGVFFFKVSIWNRTAPQYTYVSRRNPYNKTRDTYTFYTTQNVTKDSNGFLKGASPVVALFADKIELNTEAKEQDITFEKLGVGA